MLHTPLETQPTSCSRCLVLFCFLPWGANLEVLRLHPRFQPPVTGQAECRGICGIRQPRARDDAVPRWRQRIGDFVRHCKSKRSVVLGRICGTLYSSNRSACNNAVADEHCSKRAFHNSDKRGMRSCHAEVRPHGKGTKDIIGAYYSTTNLGHQNSRQ